MLSIGLPIRHLYGSYVARGLPADIQVATKCLDNLNINTIRTFII